MAPRTVCGGGNECPQSLIETLGASLTPELLNSIGKLTGEPSGAIGKVLGAALPTILSGIAGRAQQPGFLEKILGMANEVAGQGGLLPKLGTIIAQGTLPAPLLAIGEKLLALLFGNKAGALAGALASLGGVRSSSATTLLGLAAPMVLGALGDKVRSSGVNAMGLASLLGNEQKSFAALVPQGLLGVLGSGAATAAATGVAAKIPASAREHTRRPLRLTLHPLPLQPLTRTATRLPLPCHDTRCAPGCCGGLDGNTSSPRRRIGWQPPRQLGDVVGVARPDGRGHLVLVHALARRLAEGRSHSSRRQGRSSGG